jgi:hypothetical protein
MQAITQYLNAHQNGPTCAQNNGPRKCAGLSGRCARLVVGGGCIDRYADERFRTTACVSASRAIYSGHILWFGPGGAILPSRPLC